MSTAKHAQRKAPKPAPPPMIGDAWPAFNVQRKPLSWLKPYERNARTHDAAQIEQLRASFRKFGWTVPVLAREDGTLIAGHGRVDAAKLEGLTEVPVIIAVGWTDEQCRLYAIADNRIALNSEWDEERLKIELQELNGLLGKIELNSLGFAEDELGALLAPLAVAGLTDPDDAPEASPDKVVARAGDLWLLGRHRLLCGDATISADVLRLLGGEAPPSLMVTDPPYGVDYDPKWRAAAGLSKSGAHGKVANDHRADWREAWSLFPGAIAYVWHSGLHGSVVEESLRARRFTVRAQIIWVKPRPVISRGAYHWQHEPVFYAVEDGAEDNWRFVPEHEVAAYAVLDGQTADWRGGRKQSTVWFIEHIKSETGHGTQKPVECMKRPIENNSLPGQAVYDPFCGSGTTFIAAEMTGRLCLALEIDPIYIDVAVRRWEAFTGENATLDGDGRTFGLIATERLREVAA